MGGVEVSIDVGGQTPQFAHDVDGEDATYSFAGLTEGQEVTVTSALVGQWVTVDNLGAGGDLSVSRDATVTEADLDLIFNEPLCDTGSRAGLPCDPTGDPVVECPGGGVCDWVNLEFDTAQVNVFLAVQATHDWFKALQPDFNQIDTSLPAGVNDPAFTCNAASVGRHHLTFSPATIGQCSNSGYSSLASHEYGHFIHRSRIASFDLAFAEGFADAVATLMWDSEMFGLGWLNNLEVPFTRNVDDPDVRFLDQGTYPEWCSSGSHCAGLALAGAFWDLRKQLLRCNGGTTGGTCDANGFCAGGIDAGKACTQDLECQICRTDDDCVSGTCTDDSDTERLFADFLFISDARFDESLFVEVLVADDDDGDLTTSSPHQQEIEHAFVDLHGWPGIDAILCQFDPAQNEVLSIDWIGPTSGPPVQGTDYSVYYLNESGDCKPHITLITSEKPPSPVIRWFVGRTLDGEPADIGTIAAEWADPTIDNPGITVQVGTEPAGNVNNVNVVAIPKPASDMWSSAILQIGGICEGGTNAGDPCDRNSDCAAGGGTCSAGDLQRRCVSVVFADMVFAISGLASACTSDADCGAIGPCAAGNLREATVQADDTGGGGRIGGTIQGTTRAITAQGVGTGDASGQLKTNGFVSNINLTSVPINSEFIAVGSQTNVHQVSLERLDGAIEIQGDLKGTCDGGLNSGGACIVDGDCPAESAEGNAYICRPAEIVLSDGMGSAGRLYVTGDITASVEINITGGVAAGAEIKADGAILGDVQVSGTFSGDICADNLFCSEPLPLWIDIPNFSGTICGQTPGSCNEPTAPVIDDLGGVLNVKNRFLSFVGQNPGDQTAIRVAFVDLGPPFGIWNGYEMWVGPTSQVSENASEVAPSGGSTFTAATLQCEPYYQDWGALGLVHVFHEGIVPRGTGQNPGGIYQLQAIRNGIFSVAATVNQSVWGDTVQDLSEDPPLPANGPPVDVADALAVIEKFSNAPGAIAKARADMIGNATGFVGAGCVDLSIDVIDALGALRGFAGVPYANAPSAADPCDSTCPNPLPGSGGGAGSSGQPAEASFTLVADAELIEPGQGVNVHVFVTPIDPYSALDVGSYQVALEVTGGTAGSLTLTEVTVDETRQDYVFLANSTNDLVMIDQVGSRIGNLLTNGTAVGVTDPVYLATFSYVPTAGAEGVFQVAVKGGYASALLDSDDEWIPWEAAACSVIGVGVDCLTDAHCDDSDDCTLDTCVANACTFSNQASGFACDDGKFCTTGETCDGAGTCTGGNPTCGPGQLCCEITDECGPCELPE